MNQPAPTKPAPPPPRRKRVRWKPWLFRGGAALALLLAIPVVLVLHYTRPKNLKPLLEHVLSREVGGEVTIGQATLTRHGELTLDSLWVDVPGLGADRDEFAKLFDAERITVQLDYSRL